MSSHFLVYSGQFNSIPYVPASLCPQAPATILHNTSGALKTWFQPTCKFLPTGSQEKAGFLKIILWHRHRPVATVQQLGTTQWHLQNGRASLENLQFLIKLSMHLPHDPVVSLLSSYLRIMKTHIHTKSVHTERPYNCQKWKQPDVQFMNR